MKIYLLFLLIPFIGFSQLERTDSISNFVVDRGNLIWQKQYELQDENKLDQKLKSHELTNNLDILNFESSAISNLIYINGGNLPTYTKKGFRAFIIVDLYDGEYRVTIKQITFPDFKENVYYNGLKQNSRTGSLENYILSPNNMTIKRNSTTLNVLTSFDLIFRDAFER